MFWLAKNGKSSLFPFSFPVPKNPRTLLKFSKHLKTWFPKHLMIKMYEGVDNAAFS